LNLGARGSVTSRINVLSAIIAAGVHDVDHPGLDNKYLVRTEHPVAKRFNDQHVLENHSTNLCLELLRDPATNFVEGSIVQEKKYWQKACACCRPSIVVPLSCLDTMAWCLLSLTSCCLAVVSHRSLKVTSSRPS
jgi:hypothetical protein